MSTNEYEWNQNKTVATLIHNILNENELIPQNLIF